MEPLAEVLKEKALAHWDLINRLAVRRFGTAPLAEEAALYVMDSLAADSWKRLQAHSGKGSFKSYLALLCLERISALQNDFLFFSMKFSDKALIQ